MKKKVIQISFGKDSDVNEVRRQLEMVRDYYKDQDVSFEHCFLPRKVVESKGWSTDICDLLDEVLGDKHSTRLEKYDSFESCMNGLEFERNRLAKDVDVIYILGEKLNKGVIKEVSLVTDNKVVFVEWGSENVMIS